jgi:hypothetical protein
MSRDGHTAVTSRRLEVETGLKVHYHFGNTLSRSQSGDPQP